MQNRYRPISKKLKIDTSTRKVVVDFEGTLAKNLTNNRNYYTHTSEINVYQELLHFAQRNCTKCDVDENNIFTLKALHREIDKLKDYKAISVDKTSPYILKGCKAALLRPLIIFFRKSFTEGIAPMMRKLANVTQKRQ